MTQYFHGPVELFGKTKNVRYYFVQNGENLKDTTDDWDETLYIERPEDFYALMSPQLRRKKVRVVALNDFRRAF